MPPKKTSTAAASEKAVAPAETKGKKAPAPAAPKEKATPKEKAPAAPKPKGKAAKTAREDETSSPTSPTTDGAATKKLRRESSIGEGSIMPDKKSMDNFSQEEVEKDTVPFDYADCIAKNNSKVFPSSDYLKLITWNVAGLRALLKSGYDKSELKQLITEEAPDVLCLQETKLSDAGEAAKTGLIPGYSFVENLSTAKLGYAGTRTYVKDGVFDLAASKHFKGFDIIKNPTAEDDEGRIVTSVLIPATKGDLPLAVVNTYVPNSGMKLERLNYRVADFDKIMRNFLAKDLPQVAPATKDSLIWLGDLNVAEKNFDRFHNGNYKVMQSGPGFTPPERASFRKTLEEANLVDSFRHFYPNHRGAYTFYSRMFNQRAKGNGWRLDYFAVSAGMMKGGASSRVAGTSILSKFAGSDHIPSVLFVRRR